MYCEMPRLEVDCISRSIALDASTLLACGMPKLRKSKGKPLPCRPVVGVVGIHFHCISR